MSALIERTVDRGALVKPESLSGFTFSSEAGAHTFVITAALHGEEQPISGTITGSFLGADNEVVDLTGTAVNGKAELTLTGECYAVPGRFLLTIYRSSGDETEAIYSAIGTVMRADSETHVDTGIIPNFASLTAAQDAANDAADRAEAAADTIESAVSSIGQQGRNEANLINGLNRFPIDNTNYITTYENKKCSGYDTTLKKPLDFTDQSGQNIYVMDIAAMRTLGITQIKTVFDSDVSGQKRIAWTEGSAASNSVGTSSDGVITFNIASMTSYDNLLVTATQGAFYIKYTKSFSGETNEGVSEWVHAGDIEDGAIQEEHIQPTLLGHIDVVYPFDLQSAYALSTRAQVLGQFGRGGIVHLRIYNADDTYFYALGNMWKNHAQNGTRKLGLYRVLKSTPSGTKVAVGEISKDNGGTAPDFIERFEWTAETGEYCVCVVNWADVGNTYTTYGVVSDSCVDYRKDWVTEIQFDNYMRKAFPFTGNIVCEATGEKKYSTGYDSTTKLPTWTSNDNYRTYFIPVPTYGTFSFPLMADGDTTNYQLYLLDADGKRKANVPGTRTSASNARYVKANGVITFDNKACYDYGARYITATFKAVGTYAVKPEVIATGAYIPAWLGVQGLQAQIDSGSGVEMILPSKLRVCGGVEANIYYQNCVRYFNILQAQKFTANGGFTNNQYFARYTPAASASGSENATIALYKNNTLAATFEKTVSVETIASTAGSGTKKVLFIGDSMTAAGVYEAELLRMFEEDTVSIEILGATGTSEGHSGWRAYTYCRCATYQDDQSSQAATPNPFYNSGHFDFSKYMTDKSYSGVDYVFICLGTNDIVRGNHQSDEDLLEYYDEMIDSIHEYDEDIRVALWLPPVRAMYQNSQHASFDAALRMNKFLIENYDGREDENIYLCPVYLNIDPYHDYPYETVQISARNSGETYHKCTDGTHPAAAGYHKIADVIYSLIKYFTSLT